MFIASEFLNLKYHNTSTFVCGKDIIFMRGGGRVLIEQKINIETRAQTQDKSLGLKKKF